MVWGGVQSGDGVKARGCRSKQGGGGSSGVGERAGQLRGERGLPLDRKGWGGWWGGLREGLSCKRAGEAGKGWGLEEEDGGGG